jgi:hypothetical protein
MRKPPANNMTDRVLDHQRGKNGRNGHKGVL